MKLLVFHFALLLNFLLLILLHRILLFLMPFMLTIFNSNLPLISFSYPLSIFILPLLTSLSSSLFLHSRPFSPHSPSLPPSFHLLTSLHTISLLREYVSGRLSGSKMVVEFAFVDT